MNIPPIRVLLLSLSPFFLSACGRMHAEEKQHAEHAEHQAIVVTTPLARDVTITQPYVCQIRAQSFIEVRALQDGYLKEIAVKEGQFVHKGDVMFEVVPILYRTRMEAERAKAANAQIKYETTKNLYDQKPPVVSYAAVGLAKAELDEANARVATAEAELAFASVKAPFSGIVDRQMMMHGSLVEKKDVLTTLSDNSVMRAYFNVPEARYLEDKAANALDPKRIDLILANGEKFPQHCQAIIIEGKFNNETGNIAYRADFPNPTGLLRHGQTGTILIHRTLHNALVIPQRATFELLDKRYVYVVDENHVVHQRLISIQNELDDMYVIKSGYEMKDGVIKSGLEVKDKIVLEGVRDVHHDDKVEYEFKKPEVALAVENQKFHAE